MNEHLSAVRLRVGRKVKQLRRFYGLTQAQLAARIGNQQQLIGHIERGQANVTIDVLIRISKRLSVDTSELFRPNPHDQVAGETCIVPREVLERVDETLRALKRAARASAPRRPADADQDR